VEPTYRSDRRDPRGRRRASNAYQDRGFVVGVLLTSDLHRDAALIPVLLSCPRGRASDYHDYLDFAD
jgi:hypothetical protein